MRTVKGLVLRLWFPKINFQKRRFASSLLYPGAFFQLPITQLLLLLLLVLPIFVNGQESINEFEVLANEYLNQGKYKQAAESFNKSGYDYRNRGNKRKAADVFEKAYKLFDKEGNDNVSIEISNNLGIVYLDENKYANAYTAFSNTLKHARRVKDTTEIFNSLINVGSLAIELSLYSNAIDKVNEALGIAKERNNNKYLKECYSLLARSYERIGNTSSANEFYKLYSIIDQQINNIEPEEISSASNNKFSILKKERQIAEIRPKFKNGELRLTPDSMARISQLLQQMLTQIGLRNSQLRQKEIQLQYEKHIRRTLIIGIIVVLIFLVILGFLLRQKQLYNKILKQQKEEITQQRNKLDVQNKKITDSIYFGLRIQQAILPRMKELNKVFETLLIYKAKDIVSGDFYWYHESIIDEVTYHFIAVVDCTGHGVPGAFMSIIGNRILNEIIIERRIFNPSEILIEVNKLLRRDLEQDNNKTISGMDIALCRISFNNGYNELAFSGAKREIIIYKANTGTQEIIHGDKLSIGCLTSGKTNIFNETKRDIDAGDIIFMFTDGIIDQPNIERKRFGTERFMNFIAENIDSSMDNIESSLESLIDNYKESEEQRDDITVLGIKLK
ncbi:MAG: hypothetical protein EHM93_08185 [Bacteroidales bacterium]|nr:MAG: hypothetical protein EHM93_08185 [Bacteroidales bacterium]